MSDTTDEILAILRRMDAKFDRLHVELRQFLDRTSPHISRFERMTSQVRGEEAVERKKSWERVGKYLDALIAHYECGTPLPPANEAAPATPMQEVDSAMLGYRVTIKPVGTSLGMSRYVALVPDLPAGIAGGATPEAALARIKDEIKAWINAATAAGRPVPPPSPYGPE
jgi:predicted RNase H-like HicB family nuclease